MFATLSQLKNYGFRDKELSLCDAIFRQNNLEIYRAVSFITTLLLLSLALSSFLSGADFLINSASLANFFDTNFLAEVMVEERVFYVGMAAVFFFFYITSFFPEEKMLRLIPFLIYLPLLMVFFLVIEINVKQPGFVSVFFPVFIMSFPLLFIDKFHRIFFFSLTLTLVFLFSCFIHKSRLLASQDMLNALSIFMVSMFFHFKVSQMKIRSALRGIEKNRAINHLLRAKQMLSMKVERDELTGLYSRNRMIELADALMAEMPPTPYALGIMDLDNFKYINDTYGHTTGDEVLRDIGRIFVQVLRDRDFASRIGGDEFIFILHGIHEIAIAKQVSDRLLERLVSTGKNKGLRLNASIGIAFAPKHGTQFDVIYARADTALYGAKAAGKHCVIMAKDEDPSEQNPISQ